MTGHNEKLSSTEVLILKDNANKVFSAGDVGMVILSGPDIYLNNGTSWVKVN